MSFTANSNSLVLPETPSDLLKGTYGSSLVNLTIKEDQTFTYADLSDKSNPIRVSGTYTYTRGKLVLTSGDDVQFHNKWSVHSDSKSIKSRKGMAFYRLCLQD